MSAFFSHLDTFSAHVPTPLRAERGNTATIHWVALHCKMAFSSTITHSKVRLRTAVGRHSAQISCLQVRIRRCTEVRVVFADDAQSRFEPAHIQAGQK
ncbi:uncharacterized protein YALI1_E07354g [Yarrowia lipolytica]|uniref:Uncharacterized protein n=1 Tax=Yarrowia lipolytica TaxID=4952 RepID=A0A1D8NHB2_YARLL|nr:hypothetical protein YALI1_E07354g [Yarrowia lipolytica]